MDREDEVSKIFIISVFLCLTGSETLLFTRKKKAKRVNLKSCFSLKHALVHNLELKKILKFYLLYKLRTFGDKSRNSSATKTTLNYSGPCRRVRPAKLTYHSALTKLEI